MAGRGRGRGKGFTFNVEQLGFGRGDALPTPVLQPPPVFPPLQYRAVPLDTGEEAAYLLALKQEFRCCMEETPYYIKPNAKKQDIDRYSDKYRDSQSKNSVFDVLDWSRFPTELKPAVKRKRSVKKIAVPKVKKAKVTASGDVTKTLEALEKQETTNEDEEDNEEEKPKEGEEDEEKELDEEEYDEEEQEEGTDYIYSYFDNGEGYLDEEDDNLDDGPTY